MIASFSTVVYRLVAMLLSTNTIVANDNVEEINVRATTWDKGRVNITVTTYNPTQFTFVANGITNITINMFDLAPTTEYCVYRDGFSYINISSTLDGRLVFTVPLCGTHTIDVIMAGFSPDSYCVDAVQFVCMPPEASNAVPSITSYTPDEILVNDAEDASRTFSIMANQTVDVTWIVNGAEVFNSPAVTESSYTNMSAVAGYWDISAVVENTNGTAMHTWVWNVTP